MRFPSPSLQATTESDPRPTKTIAAQEVPMIRIEFPSSKGRQLMLGVVLLLLVPLLLGTSVWAASGVGQPEGATVVIGTPPQVTKSPIDVTGYITNGYSAVGPITVFEVPANSLVLYRYPENLVVDLKGKKTSFLDTSGNKISKSSIKKDSRVYVFQKGNEVIVYLLEKREGGTNE